MVRPFSNIDTTNALWDDVYLCRVSNFKTMSADYLRVFGAPTTFDPEIDNELGKELITVMISIAEMIEYFQEGIAIRVVRESDTKFIYEAISKHILGWRDALEKGVNVGAAPLNDLIVMDQFAQEVYPHATAHFDRGVVDSLFIRKLGSSGTFNPNNILKNLKSSDKPGEEEPEKEVMVRHSMADFFKDKTARKPLGLRKWQS